MQGLSVMIETLAQYSALMVMKKLYGEDGMRQFFAFQRDRYLSGRRTQVVDEEPLISVGMNQDYVDYGKGALVFYLLHERIGEEAVNRALRRFVDRYRFTEAPYPRSVDLVRMLRQEANTPENQALITDLFERITLYDLKMEGPKIAKRSDGKWEVTVPVTAKKFHANGKGTKREAPLDESIEIAFFVKHPNASGFGPRDLIGSEWRRVRSGRQIFRFVTSRKPGYAGIDPNGLYIDRSFEDNFSPVSE